ncbi:hypothetical protein AB6E53_17485 [Vibrio breoganii]|uniref:hypothetical protein n=1 Tax=Vibrio breoganii TaxID=553239 RepID=UPI0019CFC45E|nr:hypothetical protein [Vibrio breoganii]
MIKVVLKIVRTCYRIISPETSKFGRNWYIFPNKEYSSALIKEELLSDKPVMISRLGSVELTCMTNYLGVKNPSKYKNIKSFVKSQSPQWWWSKNMTAAMKLGPGFFPEDLNKIEQFCELMISDLDKVDVLGSWLKSETFFSNELSNSKKVMLEDLEPFFTKNPWTEALRGKKVLVVHPFAETIKSQYARKDKIFPNGLLPDFELQVMPAVQSIAGENPDFTDWFEALESMKKQISKHDFDICILGCGAYGFPLAAYVKSIGKKAIHLGGVTQMLFGIKGARWEEYIVYPYQNLMNEYWVRPGENEKPKDAVKVEGGCYW